MYFNKIFWVIYYNQTALGRYEIKHIKVNMMYPPHHAILEDALQWNKLLWRLRTWTPPSRSTQLYLDSDHTKRMRKHALNICIHWTTFY